MPSHNTSLQILTLSYFVCLLLWAEDGPTRLTHNIYKERTNVAVNVRVLQTNARRQVWRWRWRFRGHGHESS